MSKRYRRRHYTLCNGDCVVIAGLAACTSTFPIYLFDSITWSCQHCPSIQVSHCSIIAFDCLPLIRKLADHWVATRIWLTNCSLTSTGQHHHHREKKKKNPCLSRKWRGKKNTRLSRSSRNNASNIVESNRKIATLFHLLTLEAESWILRFVPVN